MKKVIPLFFAAAIFMFSCNNSSSDSSAHTDHQEHAEGSHDQHNDSGHASTEESAIQTVKPVYANLDADVASFVSRVVKSYLDVKSALVNSDEASAAKYAAELNNTLKSFDKSHFTVDQKKDFDKVESSLIGSSDAVSTPGLDAQRQQFLAMSNSVYELVKQFDAGTTLYHEFCPMYGDDGGLWLSDSKEIANPYFGDKMMKCGTVKEVIQL